MLTDTLTALPTQWLGYAAASFTTLSFLPQAVLTLRTRDVSGISASMYGAFTVGVALWLGLTWAHLPLAGMAAGIWRWF